MRWKIVFFNFIVFFAAGLFAQQNQYYLSFDGGDYVKYYNDSYLQMLDGASDYTLEAWIYPDTTVEKYDRIFQRYYSFNAVIWHITEDKDSCDWYFTVIDDGGSSHYFNARRSIALGAWNHIAIINNSTAGTLRLYVNGVDVTTENYANFSLRAAQNNDNFYVGQKGNGTDYFSGYIDEVRLKNEAIDPGDLNQEIMTNYESDAHTALLLHFDEGEGYHWTWNAASENDSARLGGVDAGDDAEPTWVEWNGAAVDQSLPPVPREFYVGANYPNPFNPETSIPVYLPTAGKVWFTVMTVNGRILQNRELFLKAGENRILFRGESLSSGLYFYRVRFKDRIAHGKMLMIK
jgi:hypothetical protein